MHCTACWGDHEPDPPGFYVAWRGNRYTAPFLCLCCGVEICGQQFAFGQACGACDVGACKDNPFRGTQASYIHDAYLGPGGPHTPVESNS